jgi:hypothetical protein
MSQIPQYVIPSGCVFPQKPVQNKREPYAGFPSQADAPGHRPHAQICHQLFGGVGPGDKKYSPGGALFRPANDQ